jgi:hypothetical protein
MRRETATADFALPPPFHGYDASWQTQSVGFTHGYLLLRLRRRLFE